MSWAHALASSKSAKMPSLPGMVGTPASFIVALADALLNRGEGIIRKKDIDAFASAIARHTENFDALYVDAANALDAPCGARGCASAAA